MKRAQLRAAFARAALAEAEAIRTVEAVEFADHDAAIRPERELGFVVESDPNDPNLRVVRTRL